jgi:acyl-CoA synthetase (AMP-forming)/AMP-acid ligase II
VLPGVTDAAVWLERSHGRDFLAAAVETTQARVEVEQALAAQLPAWKMPRSYVLARELPRTARGKLDLPALRRRSEKTPAA